MPSEKITAVVVPNNVSAQIREAALTLNEINLCMAHITEILQGDNITMEELRNKLLPHFIDAHTYMVVGMSLLKLAEMTASTLEPTTHETSNTLN